MEEATNYMGLLFNDNEQLKNLLGAYLNSIVFVFGKYQKPDGSLKPIEVINQANQQEKDLLIQLANNYRSYATRIILSMESISIKTKIKDEQLKSIRDNYAAFKNIVYPGYNDMEQFAQQVNNVVVEKLNIHWFIANQQKINDVTRLNQSYQG
jgi:hypothetical protein